MKRKQAEALTTMFFGSKEDFAKLPPDHQCKYVFFFDLEESENGTFNGI